MQFNPKTFRTLEFLLVVLTNVAAWLAEIAGSLQPQWAAAVTAASGAAYAISRGLAKQNADTKDYWQTTEFWIGLVTAIPAAITALQGSMGAHTYTLIQGTVAALIAVAMGIRKDPMVAAGAVAIDDLPILVDPTYTGPPDGDDRVHAPSPPE